MLVAISKVTHSRILAGSVDRSHPVECPECREPLVHKMGRIRIHHFAHNALTICSLSQGESPRHLQMKQQIPTQFIEGTRIEFEWPVIAGRRADIALPDHEIIIECQASPISIEEYEQRTRDYNRQGWSVFWVWDIRRVYRPKYRNQEKITRFPENYEWDPHDEGAEEPEYRVPAEVQYCHAQNGDLVFVLDQAGQLKPCRLRDATVRYHEWYDEDGEYRESETTPTTLKRIRHYPWELMFEEARLSASARG